MNYYSWHWDESRGDRHAMWGDVTYFYEVDDGGRPVRQMEVYRDGTVLKYHSDHRCDIDGGLAEHALDLAEWAASAIPRDEFERAWNERGAINC